MEEARSSGRIKGTGIVGLVRALRAERAQAERVLPAQLHHYLDLRVVLTAWFPEVDYLGLLQAYIRIYKTETWERAGVAAARLALSGVYRHIVIPGNVEETAVRMRINWRNYHDTGVLTADNEPRLVRVSVEGYCLVNADVCRLNTGYFGEILAIAGALVTDHRKPLCTARGDPKCVWEYTWTR